VPNQPQNLVSSWSQRKKHPIPQRCETPTRVAQKKEIAEFIGLFDLLKQKLF